MDSKILAILAPLLLVGLVVMASVGLYQVRALALPIPIPTMVATVVLPILTGLGLTTHRPHGLSGENKRLLSWSTLLPFMILFMYDTVISTLAFTHIIPSSELNCGLEQRWHQLFSDKNAETVRRIQDRHQCCGFNSALDRAWPFPDRQRKANACIEAFGRQGSCRGGWRQDEQIAAGLALLVAVSAFLLKIIFLYLTLQGNRQNPIRNFFARSRSGRGNNVDRLPRRIQNQEYHDDPNEDADAGVRGNVLVQSEDQVEHSGSHVERSEHHRGGEGWGDA